MKTICLHISVTENRLYYNIGNESYPYCNGQFRCEFKAYNVVIITIVNVVYQDSKSLTTCFDYCPLLFFIH